MTLFRLRSGLMVALAAAVAVGCVQLPAFSAIKTASPAGTQSAPSPSPLVAFLANARPGDSTFVNDPATGQRVSVTADKIYYAASGQHCRRYTLANSESGARLSAGLACKNGEGKWNLFKLIANPNDVNAPQTPVTARPGSS